MRQLLFFVFMLLAIPAAAEDFVEHTTQASNYTCRVDGVEQEGSHRDTTKANQRATNLKLSSPELPVICDKTETIVTTLTAAGKALVADTAPPPDPDPDPTPTTSVTLNWTNPTKNVDGTPIAAGALKSIGFIQTKPDGRQWLGSVAPNALGYVVEDVTPGQEYCFVAKAKTDVLSADSNKACVTP